MFFECHIAICLRVRGIHRESCGRQTALPWREFLTRLDERENIAMNLDVNLRHFLEVPKDLAIKRG